MKSRKAFTLLEVVTVLVIIVVLIALLLPTFSRVRGQAQTAVCATRLRGLGQAHSLRRADASLTLIQRGIVDPANWVNDFSPYLSSPVAFTCPTDTTSGGPWGGRNPSESGYGSIVEIPSFYLMVSWSGINFRVPFSNTHPRMAIRPWTVRPVGQRWRGSLVNYTDPPQYAAILEFLDDGNDFYAPMGPNPENQFSFVAIEDRKLDAIGWKVDLYRNKQMLYADTVLPKWAPGGNDARRLKTPYGEASYGINNRVPKMPQPEQSILLIDYDKIVASLSSASATDNWTLEMSNVANRHAGRVNVLFGDGAVNTTHPNAIDPRVPALHDQYWRAQQDPRLSGG